MRREEFCKKTGVSVWTFKKLMRDGHLPWTSDNQNRMDLGPERGWGDYSVRELANFFASSMLREASGLSMAVASIIIRGGVSYEGERVEGYSDMLRVGPNFDESNIAACIEQKIYFTRAHFLQRNGEASYLANEYQLVRGPLAQTMDWASEHVENVNERCHFPGQHISLRGLVTVNYSEAMFYAKSAMEARS